jgi:pyrroline-5-carboxylate reductase
MGGALLAGWLDQGTPAEDLVVVDPHFDRASAPAGIRSFRSAAELPADVSPDIVLLAVKPQVMDEVLPPYARFGGAVFLSIAAGRTIASLQRSLGENTAIVRAMPNIPAEVRRGATGLIANRQASEKQKELCDRLVTAVGAAVWIEDESQLDAVTALSGSGPAYVFLMVEALAAAGEKLGLPPAIAETLARATVSGSGELLRQSPLPAATLRQHVTSPNGTTFAALEVLMDEHHGLGDLMRRATVAAARRARDLAS